MDMNKTFFLRKEDRTPEWHVIDASEQPVGRIATQAADLLRGKNKPTYTPHTDNGDYVVITNCANIKLTGNKWEDKEYVRYSGWRSGRKVATAKEVHAKDQTQIMRAAVEGMLPKNRLSRQIIKKLKVYAGSEHGHSAQVK